MNMDLVNNIELIKQVINNHAFSLLYIQAPDCGLCSIMLEKIESVAAQFNQLHSIRAEIQIVPEIAGTFLVATAPTVLVFAHGKEVYRAGTFIDTTNLERVLTRSHEHLNC